MPWVLIPGSLKNLRETALLTRIRVAKCTGLSIATVRRHEDCESLTRGLQDETVERYARALACNAEDFARWVDYGKKENHGR